MARKIKSKTDNSGWSDPVKKKKIRKRRKPMTEEQRQAASERLEKARAARASKNPNYGQSGVHESLRDLPENNPLHPNKVKKWIKTQKDLAAAERKNERANVKGATARKTSHETYVRSLQKYLRTGDYTDSLYGEHQEHVIRYRCIAMAYDKNGLPKRNVGTWYPDIGTVYTQEMFNEDRGIENANVQKTKRRRKRNKGAVEAKGKKASRSS